MTQEQTNLGEQRLEAAIMDYVRAGYTVTSRTRLQTTLEKGEQHVRLRLNDQEKVEVDGPPLPAFVMSGRLRAWLLLILLLIIVFTAAWLLGFFRM